MWAQVGESSFGCGICLVVAKYATVRFDFLKKSGERLTGSSEEEVLDSKKKWEMDLLINRFRIPDRFVYEMDTGEAVSEKSEGGGFESTVERSMTQACPYCS